MKNPFKYKIDFLLVFLILVFAGISIATIYSSQTLLMEDMQTLYIKQATWYSVGLILAIVIMIIGNDSIYKNAWILYIIGVISLVLLLIFGEPINNAKCWFVIPGIGSIQPSEFMKIILIITLGSMIHSFNEQYPNPSTKNEFLFLLKVMVVVAIPSILTFLQPDTGVVLIYLLITIIMLYTSGIRIRWFGLGISIIGIAIASVLFVYFKDSNLFIKIFGTDFFLRVDRLLDWSNQSGYQLENGMSAIGAGGMLGSGFLKTPIYFPEPQTDFIFAVFANNFGFIGSALLLFLITIFDIRLIYLALKSKNQVSKYVISGILGMLIYQQLQNIGMTIGLFPITGITLPFISYGGSSLLSYMIMAGILLNISNETYKYKNS